MPKKLSVDLVARQNWLEPIEDRLQRAISAVFESAGPNAPNLKNFLHGTWYGEPLHPALTDIPLGGWTAALALDGLEAITGRREFGVGADAAISVGIAGAAMAAVTGLADWHSTDGAARRIGVTHALFNVAGLACYTTSLVLRKKDSRQAGVGFALLGYALAGVAAHLGGELVFGQQIGVDHAADVEAPEDFTPVLDDAELAEGQMRRVEVNATKVLVARREGRIMAIAETCTHLGGPLAEGRVEDDAVECPWHGSRFSLEDGRVIQGPAVHPQLCFQTRVREGKIEVGPECV